MTEEKDKKNEATTIATGLSNIQNVERHGAAADIYARGYNGGDVGRTLEKISGYANDNAQGSKQGYTAERLISDKRSAKNALEGNPNRHMTTDELGISNDPVVDLLEVNASGSPVAGSGSQVKFVKSHKLVDGYINNRKVGAGRWDRYDKVAMEVPSDMVNEIRAEIEKAVTKLEKQIEFAKRNGDTQLAEKLQNKIDRANILKNNLKDSGVSTAEAEYAVNNPVKYTAREICKTVHNGGIKGAQYGAVIGGSVALLSGVFAYANGEKAFEKVLSETALSTGKAAAKGYLTGAGGSLVKAGMQHSSRLAITKEVERELGKASQTKIAQEVAKRLANSKTVLLSKTALPALVVTTTIELSGTIAKYVKGEIDGVQFFEELGQKGTNILASSAGATLGQIIIPIPIVGAVVGGMVGYSLSAFFYTESLTAFKEAKEAKENYHRIKNECEAAREALNQYRREMESAFNSEFGEFKSQMQKGLAVTHAAILQGDMDNFCQHANRIGALIGSALQFESFEEFDEFMKTDKTLTL
jgi:two-component sensor histidine kinase